MNVGFPHEGVIGRIGSSEIADVGVFALRHIPEGTVCFVHDLAELRWIDAADIERTDLTDDERALYRHFAVRRNGKLGCPESFDLLTPGWYLNSRRRVRRRTYAPARRFDILPPEI